MDRETRWWVGKSTEDGNPLVIRAITRVPEMEQRADHVWYTVISWQYEPATNGMPSVNANARMVELEDAIKGIEDALPVLIRTGNGRKEWGYYIVSRENFTKALKNTLAGKPRFPIEITFHNDPNWEILGDVLRSAGK